MVRLEGKVAAGVMVLLVPASGEDVEKEARMDQSDTDGTFALVTIIPGRYVLTAIEDGWELHWAEEGVLKPYLRKWQTMEIASNEVKKVTV